jgi:hypothetical protein
MEDSDDEYQRAFMITAAVRDALRVDLKPEHRKFSMLLLKQHEYAEEMKKGKDGATKTNGQEDAAPVKDKGKKRAASPAPEGRATKVQRRDDGGRRDTPAKQPLKESAFKPVFKKPSATQVQPQKPAEPQVQHKPAEAEVQPEKPAETQPKKPAETQAQPQKPTEVQAEPPKPTEPTAEPQKPAETQDHGIKTNNTMPPLNDILPKGIYSFHVTEGTHVWHLTANQNHNTIHIHGSTNHIYLNGEPKTEAKHQAELEPAVGVEAAARKQIEVPAQDTEAVAQKVGVEDAAPAPVAASTPALDRRKGQAIELTPKRFPRSLSRPVSRPARENDEKERLRAQAPHSRAGTPRIREFGPRGKERAEQRRNPSRDSLY